MDKVIFFEQEEHYEVLAAFVQHFQEYSDVHIEIYCGPKVKRNLLHLFHDSVKWFDTYDDIPIDDDYKNTCIIVTSPVKKCIDDLFNHFPVYVLIHNMHHTFAPFTHLFFSKPKALFSFIKNRKSRNLNKRMIEKSQGVIFIAPQLQSYFLHNYKTVFPGKLSLVLPTFRQLPDQSQENSEKKRIVIPGSYHPTRRNFEPLIKMLAKYVFQDVDFIFPGHLETSMQSVLASANKSNSIVTYNRELDMTAYYNILIGADLLILPLNEYKYFGGIREKTGVSSFSAIWMDAFSAGIPALLPAYLKTDDEFTSYFFPFQDENDLALQISEYFASDYLSLKMDFRNKIKQYFNPMIKSAIHEILNNESSGER